MLACPARKPRCAGGSVDTRRLRAGRRLDLPVPASVGGHTDPRRCTHAARQPIQGHAIVVTHTFHAQEPTEPRVPAKLLRHLLSGSLPRGRALVARAYFRVALLPLPAKHVSGGGRGGAGQDRGRDQHFARHNTLAKRLHLRAAQGKGKAKQWRVPDNVSVVPWSSLARG